MLPCAWPSALAAERQRPVGACAASGSRCRGPVVSVDETPVRGQYPPPHGTTVANRAQTQDDVVNRSHPRVEGIPALSWLGRPNSAEQPYWIPYLLQLYDSEFFEGGPGGRP